MQTGKARQSRGGLVGYRVVLHRAAAEGIEVLADRIVERSHAAVVAHDLGLAEPRQPGRPSPQRVGGQHVGGRRTGDLCIRKSGRVDRRSAQLEAEWLDHASSTAMSPSRARASLTSVQVNVTTPFSSRNQRLTSRPPRIPFRASLRSTAGAFGTRTRNSFKNWPSGKASSQPGRAASRSARACDRLKLTSAMWRSPYGPMYVR